MDIDRNAHPHPADDSVGDAELHGVPAVTLALVHAIGARLRAPLSTHRREQLVHELAAAAAEGSGGAGASGGPDDRVASRTPSPVGPEQARPQGDRPARRSRRVRGIGALAAALVLLAGAVGVLSRDGDSLPTIVLATGPAGTTAAAGPLMEGRSDAAAGAMLWWVPTTYRFVLADGVGFPAGRSPAWRLVPPADRSAAAAALAATFGLPGLGPSEWDPQALWAESATAGSLWVAPSGDWYYNGPSDLWPVWDCAVADAPDVLRGDGASGTGSIEPALAQDCTAPEPPVGVPSAARARLLAVEFLATVGHPDVRITDVWADEWSAWVSAEPVVAGLPAGSGLTVSVGFAGGERVASANGTLATVQLLGEYPTIDAGASIARLEADLNAWQAGGPVARPFPADAGVEAGPSDAPVSDRDAPVTILPVPDHDVEGPGLGPEPEPVEVTLTIVSVELVASAAWAATGEMLILPHYRLTDSEGGWWFVVAVDDRYLSR